MDDAILLTHEHAGVLTLTLNRPEKRNALSLALRKALRDTLERAETNSNVEVVILTGAGSAFCAGLDLREMSGEEQTAATLGGAVDGAEFIDQLEGMSKPVIAAVNGVAITGGFELALACDVVLASSNASFADTHARVGILPGWGLSQKLSRLIGVHRAKELSLTGNFLSAEQAERWGLVNRLVSPSELLQQAGALARDMMSCDALALRRYKHLINEGFGMTYRDGLVHERARSHKHAAEVRPEDVAARRRAIEQRGRAQAQ